MNTKYMMNYSGASDQNSETWFNCDLLDSIDNNTIEYDNDHRY